MLVDGRPLPTYFRAYVADGRVFAPLEPVLLRLADRAWIDGSTLVVERDGRSVRVLLPGGERRESAYVEVGPLVRSLGEAVSYDVRRRRLDVWTPAATVALPTPFDAAAPAQSPRAVFTPAPIATPRPVWSGPPLPRRTPLPLALPRVSANLGKSPPPCSTTSRSLRWESLREQPWPVRWRSTRCDALAPSLRSGTIGSITLFVSVGETLVAIVGGLVVLGYLGISVAPILTAFGIGGLAVALALQDTLANFFSGIQIAASRQVHAGDFVRLDADNAGTVIDINWRNTVIRDPDGNRIIVPNQKLAQAIFTAYRLPLQVPVTVTLDRGADLGRITEVARETAKRIVRAAPESEIYVRFKKIAEGSVDMVVTLPAKDPAERRRLGSEFAKAFLQRVGAEDLKSEQVKAVAT